MSTESPKEIEFKYKADNIALSDFVAFCKSSNPISSKEASGFDYFYAHPGEPDSFARHRIEPGKFNQVSFKRKTVGKNNFIRVEHNITLGDKVSPKEISDFLKEFGYGYNTSIFKNCFIHQYNDHVIVFYVCFNQDFKEIGRFIEIEIDEMRASADPVWAMSRLSEIECEMKVLGITPQARIKRSLFEMYRK